MSRVDPAAGLPLESTALPEASEFGPDELEIRESTYAWSVRLFSVFRRLLRVELRLHGEGGAERAIAEGDIFLFNHFSRFETFIPQYLIYQSTGALCRSIASKEFFTPGDPLTGYLLRVGAVPNNLPNLLPFLAREILKGRKVIVFPEGGMVKDRRVIDPDGEYRVYSRTARDRRKHHAGAAVLGLEHVEHEAEPLKSQLSSFLDAVRTGRKPDIDAQDGFANVRTAQRIVEAAKQ
jgi:1-acyl-sn-glycerol-3-phosphate acyltransferase